MIVNSLLHFFLNVLGAKRQEDRNDWGRGGRANDQWGATTRVETSFGRQD